MTQNPPAESHDRAASSHSQSPARASNLEERKKYSDINIYLVGLTMYAYM